MSLQQLSFEEICPQWTKAVLENRSNKHLNGSFERCVVGEAHQFKGTYSDVGAEDECVECREYAFKLVNGRKDRNPAILLKPGSRDLVIDHKLFEEKSRAFTKHWNEKHV